MARFIKSISHAFQGIKDSFDGQSNIKIQIFIAIIVLIAGFQFNISRIEWILLLLTIGAVFTSEMINSAIETTVNLHCSQENSLAKRAKDIAAGAVLTIAIIAAIIGLIVFIPYLFN